MITKIDRIRSGDSLQKCYIADAVLTGLISAGAGIASTGINAGMSAWNSRQTELTNQLNRKWQLEDRAHDEIYNSPAAQKARLRSAGLAPEEYVDVAQTDSNTSQATAPQMDASLGNGLANAVNQGVNAFNSVTATEQNKRMNDAQEKVLTAQAEETYQRAVGLKTDNIYKAQEHQLDITLKGLQASSLTEDVNGKKIANFLAEQTKQSVIDLANYRARVALATEGDEIAQKHLQTTGIELDNSLKTITIKGKKYEVNNLLPLNKEILEKNLIQLEKNGRLTEAEITQLDDAHSFALMEIVHRQGIYDIDNLKNDAAYNVLSEKAESYEKYLEDKFRNEKFAENFYHSPINESSTALWRELTNVMKMIVPFAVAGKIGGTAGVAVAGAGANLAPNGLSNSDRSNYSDRWY